MPLADDIMTRYRSKSGGERESAAEDAAEAGEPKSEAQIAAGKALIAAVKRGDAEAVCEAVRTIASEY